MIVIEHVELPQADRGYIYFADITIDGETFQKVGYSKNPLRRFDTVEFEEVEATVKFRNIVPMQNWMYDFPEGNPSSDYWEQVLHQAMRHTIGNTVPEHMFSGWTECYLLDDTGYKAAIDYLEEQLLFMSPPNDWSISY